MVGFHWARCMVGERVGSDWIAMSMYFQAPVRFPPHQATPDLISGNTLTINKMFTIRLIASVLLHNGIQQMAYLFTKSNIVVYLYVISTKIPWLHACWLTESLITKIDQLMLVNFIFFLTSPKERRWLATQSSLLPDQHLAKIYFQLNLTIYTKVNKAMIILSHHQFNLPPWPSIPQSMHLNLLVVNSQIGIACSPYSITDQVDTLVGLEGKNFSIEYQVSSHLILLFNTVSIQLIITIKIDVKPHAILKYKFTDQSFKNEAA